MPLRRLLLPFLAAACLSAPAAAQPHERYFFQDRPYGTDALVSPVNVFLNEGFSVLQVDGFSERPLPQLDGAAFMNVMRSLARPDRAIRHYGTGRFFRDELLPLSGPGGGGQWLPNYQLHLVGGGVTYATLREYFLARGTPHPNVAAAATAVGYHLASETVENGGYRGPNADPVADLLFDVAGIALFSSERVRRFGGRTLGLRSWHLQPAVEPGTGRLVNAGSNVALRWRPPGVERWHVFYLAGMNNLLGAGYRRRDGLALSLGAGLRPTRLVTADSATNRKTAHLGPTAGLFLEHDGTLLGSVVYSGLHRRAVGVNVYPGLLRLRTFEPGFFAEVDRKGRATFGMAGRWWPGVAASPARR